VRALSEAEFLVLRELGRALHPLDLSLLAIHIALPEAQREGIADWSLGRRNHALLQLHSLCFGPALRGWVECRECREKLEFEFDVGGPISKPNVDQVERIAVYGRAFRLPTSRDLARVAEGRDVDGAALDLARRCCVGTEAECRIEELDAIGKQMALADPLADPVLHFDCPVCTASFDESVDLPAFVSAELAAHAKRLLREVHTLALAYGWSEAEILSISESRRASYVEMVCA
jgi:hypothetical protein